MSDENYRETLDIINDDIKNVIEKLNSFVQKITEEDESDELDISDFHERIFGMSNLETIEDLHKKIEIRDEYDEIEFKIKELNYLFEKIQQSSIYFDIVKEYYINLFSILDEEENTDNITDYTNDVFTSDHLMGLDKSEKDLMNEFIQNNEDEQLASELMNPQEEQTNIERKKTDPIKPATKNSFSVTNTKNDENDYEIERDISMDINYTDELLGDDI